MKRVPLRRRVGLRRTPFRTRPRQRDNEFSPEVRERILLRDRYTCQARHVWPHECQLPLVAHHVVLRGQGGPGTVENGLTLCTVAHTIAHDVDRAGAERAGIIKRRGAG